MSILRTDQNELPNTKAPNLDFCRSASKTLVGFEVVEKHERFLLSCTAACYFTDAEAKLTINPCRDRDRRLIAEGFERVMGAALRSVGMPPSVVVA